MTLDEVRARAGVMIDIPAQVGDPIEVLDAGGTQVAWFVPLTNGDRITGFVQLLPDLTHRRTAWFGHPAGSPVGCPPAAWWIDPATVLFHASSEIERHEVVGLPYLSFDTVVDRVAWAVPVRGPRGPRLVYVAGQAAWSGKGATGLN